jgi:hypothetical protein
MPCPLLILRTTLGAVCIPSRTASCEALRQKECVLFIGSGVSAWSGLPSWQQLLQQMLQFLEEHGLPPDERGRLREIKVSSSYHFMLRK